ncbi:hypothetical protein [Nannocystis radixulma]|uniref:Tripartite tricarboxylate transporter TctB family protein n=1 Tax=Nannocystis radixulma TaxID=2995305 RepID=A0ABT5BKJ6_9BACT|nr:hypothetical protein [Nannocystis radixulma]MDC0674672.1 hypothetical protein [Nannocystis radixulma]
MSSIPSKANAPRERADPSQQRIGALALDVCWLGFLSAVFFLLLASFGQIFLLIPRVGVHIWGGLAWLFGLLVPISALASVVLGCIAVIKRLVGSHSPARDWHAGLLAVGLGVSASLYVWRAFLVPLRGMLWW